MTSNLFTITLLSLLAVQRIFPVEAQPAFLRNKKRVFNAGESFAWDSPPVLETPSPSSQPSQSSSPSTQPSQPPPPSPQPSQSSSPSTQPSQPPPPSPQPSQSPSPSTQPSQPLPPVTFKPGFLTDQKEGYLLSEGLDIRVIAETGKRVTLSDGSASARNFHVRPDGAACFPHPDGLLNGYVYVSNSEAGSNTGGVGAIYFDSAGEITNYEMLLTDTTWNCGGGKTPWNTWISCEEDARKGRGVWQVDPWGQRSSQLTEVGDRNNLYRSGTWEAFAYDLSGADGGINRYFLTEDRQDGPLRRFTPKKPEVLSWEVLHEEGTHEYLLLNPSQGIFTWTTSLSTARSNAEKHYRNAEGVDCRDGHLYFVSKKLKQLYDLDLNAKTFSITSTYTPEFAGEPDGIEFFNRRHLNNAENTKGELEVTSDEMFTSTQIQRVLSRNDDSSRNARELNEEFNHPILFMTEDGTRSPGLFGMDADQNFFTIVQMAYQSSDGEETTGVALSPDRKKIYFCQQNAGICFEIWRKDGYVFTGEYLSVKYHNQNLCVDDNQWCEHWADIGECKKNPDYMLFNCRFSCNVC